MRYHYLVTYDISDPRRLRRVARVCSDFGDRVQQSVFACQLASKDLAILQTRLAEVMSAAEDQVIFVRLGRVHANDPGPEIDTLGRKLVLPTRCVVF